MLAGDVQYRHQKARRQSKNSDIIEPTLANCPHALGAGVVAGEDNCRDFGAAGVCSLLEYAVEGALSLRPALTCHLDLRLQHLDLRTKYTAQALPANESVA